MFDYEGIISGSAVEISGFDLPFAGIYDDSISNLQYSDSQYSDLQSLQYFNSLQKP